MLAKSNLYFLRCKTDESIHYYLCFKISIRKSIETGERYILLPLLKFSVFKMHHSITCGVAAATIVPLALLTIQHRVLVKPRLEAFVQGDFLFSTFTTWDLWTHTLLQMNILMSVASCSISRISTVLCSWNIIVLFAWFSQCCHAQKNGCSEVELVNCCWYHRNKHLLVFPELRKKPSQ